ncbi:MAG: prepilin-type N-terminal cleavage/methylation domain-containing protein [Bdellovibrionales bacterium]|nr:prepilin-type N-terminal cleavage/methylation domain-containing protein [Bdellovibrionales bacterium]
MKNTRGFTLIEIMIAMFILAFLSLFTVQAIQKALQTKSKVQKDIDKNSTLRDALKVMERDINLAFNYRDIYAQLYNDAQDERRKKALQPASPGSSPAGVPGGGVTPPPSAVPVQLSPEDELRFKKKDTRIWTQFIGEPEQISFTSLSNVRMMEDSPISSQAEIGYHIKACRRRSTQEQSSKCLWRRISNFIHEDITKEGEETVLLENITEFKLRYLGPGKDDEWLDTWITNERGDDVTKNTFPYAVEITIEVKDPDPKAKDKSLRMTTVAAIRNPNNKPKPQDPADPNAQPTTPIQ